VLLLRGAQAPGELKTRTDRLHTFADRDAVEVVLRRMASLPTPLVHELDRRPGQHDRRWVHLLGPVETGDVARAAEAAPAAGADRESVLADGVGARDARVREAYDAAAAAYAEQLADELARKPFDTWLLDRVATLAGSSPVVDVGTGPGHVAAHLAASGADASGVDLSPGMVDQARRLFPDLTFTVGNFANLLRPPAAAGWGAVTAWYSLVHLAGSELTPAVASLARVLAPGGWLALGVHVGAEVHHADDLCGQPVDVDFVMHDPDQVLAAVRAAGLVDVEWYLRGPYAGAEVETERLYVLARRPA
jgi:SAM-dependent methyltransferase